MALSDDRVARFARQLLVPGFGEAAQERLLSARVRAVGLEGVASAGLVYLVQAGVGRLWLDDPEDVAPADLAGWLFPPSAVGSARVDAAREALAPLSAYVEVERYPTGGVPDATVPAPDEASVPDAAPPADAADAPPPVDGV